MSEISPESVKRRWEPEGGSHRHGERIRKESKFADNYKNLPFKLSKPPTRKKNNDFECEECGRYFLAPKNTIMCICPNCKKLTKAVKI
jgi:hypothetical protein